jgi:hypothetical protein
MEDPSRTRPGDRSGDERLGMVVHTCNPSYMGGTGRRITVKASPEQKHEALSEK